MSKNKMLKQGRANPCGARPFWIPGRVDAPPRRMLCTRRRKHGGKHQNGQDHRWDQVGRRDTAMTTEAGR